MAPRKLNLSVRNKNKKIGSKKIPASKNKSPKRTFKKSAPPKKVRPNRSDLEEIEDDEFKEWLGDDVYNQLYKGNADLTPNFPLEELYHDDREVFSSDFSEDDLNELEGIDDLKEIGNPLKRKISSSNASLVERYIKSGSSHVASFIVESAIRFGQEQGVVIPEKGTKDVYQFTSPYACYFDSDDKKIRFRVPSKAFGYEDAKKAMWKRGRQKKPLHLAKSRKFIADDNTSEAIREKENFLEMETIGESSSDSDFKPQEKNNRRCKKKNTKGKENKAKFDFSDSNCSEEEQDKENLESDSIKEEKSVIVEASTSGTSIA